MFAVGVFMAWRWDTLFLDEQDYLVVGPLPVDYRTLFFSKLAALVASVGLIALAASFVPLILYPGMAAVGGVGALREYLVHPLIVVLAVAFIFSFFVAAQSILLLMFPYNLARRLGPFVQVISLAALMFMAICAFDSSELIRDFQGNGAQWLVWMPPFWFVGLYQRMLGQTDPLWIALARTAWTALGGTAAVATATLALTYSRHLKQLVEAKPARGSAHSSRLLALVSRMFTRTPGQRAGFEFFLCTISRSQRHRLSIAALLAFAVALSVQGDVIGMFGLSQQVQMTINALSMPLIFSFFAIAGLLWASTIPLGAKPAWIFEIAGSDRYPEIIAGCRRALIAATVLFPAILALATFFWKSPVAMAARYLVMTSLLLVIASVVAGRKVRQLSFSPNMRRFRPPHLIVVLIGGWLIFTLYTYMATQLQMWAAESLTRTAVVSAIFAAIVAGIVLRPIELIPPDTTRWLGEEGLLLPQLESW